jgi:ABC-type Na+ efflux pump permease subunit
MLKSKNKLYNSIIILIDMALINLGFYLAFLLKFNFNPPDYNIVPYVEIIPFITVAALVYFDIYGLLSVFEKSLYETLYSTIFAVGLLDITTIAIT